MNKMNIHKKKVNKRKSRSKTNIQEPNNLVTLNQKVTNVTHRKGGSKGKHSLHITFQELEDIATIQIEELLQSVQALEDSFQDLPSRENYLADVERLSKQMEKDLEEYLYG